MATLLIPDVSEWQADVDFAALKRQNGGAVILRAAYGASHPDLKFAAWRTRAHNAGLRAVGIYQYIVASQDITTQAKAFVSLVGKRNAGEWFIADIEEGGGNQAGRAKTWISYVQQHLGGVCWVYSGESFSGSHGLRSAAPLWIAAYRSTEPTAKHVLWQCTNGKDGAHVTSWPGAGKCDTSLYHGSLADFVKLIGGASTATEDDVPEYISLSTKAPVKVKKGQPVSVVWDKVYDGEKKDGIIPTVPALAIVEVSCSVPFQLYAQDEHDTERDLGGNNTAVVSLYKGDRLYMRLRPTADGETTPYVKAAYWKA